MRRDLKALAGLVLLLFRRADPGSVWLILTGLSSGALGVIIGVGWAWLRWR